MVVDHLAVDARGFVDVLVGVVSGTISSSMCVEALDTALWSMAVVVAMAPSHAARTLRSSLCRAVRLVPADFLASDDEVEVLEGTECHCALLEVHHVHRAGGVFVDEFDVLCCETLLEEGGLELVGLNEGISF